MLAEDRRTSIEDYLGVWLEGDGAALELGVPHELLLRLIYHPDVNYAALVPGATFTVREGPAIVGSGTVVSNDSLRG